MTVFPLLQDPVNFIIFLLAIALAIGVHEAAHAWTADKLGDNTARMLGRASINPLVHLDPIGSLLFLVLGFGWGKPVPVNESRLRHKYDVVLVALAGPISNLITAGLLGLFYRYNIIPGIQPVLSLFIFLNLSLMVFNLIPVPPLDGSRFLRLLLPDRIYFLIEQYSFILILALFLLIRTSYGGLGDWILYAVKYLFHLITGAISPI